MKRLNGAILSCLACLFVVSCSGCMIGPTQHQDIGNMSDRIYPAGFVLDSDVLIEVQSFNWEMQRWETVSTTRSGKSAYPWDGLEWHLWQSSGIQLDDKYWTSYWYEEDLLDFSTYPEGRYGVKARIRSLADGAPMYTFGYSNGRDWSLKPLRELQSDVWGSEVLVTAGIKVIH